MGKKSKIADISKEQLLKDYYDDEMSVRQIGRKYGTGDTQVYKRFDELGIERRKPKSPRIDITGQKFGALIAIEPIKSKPSKNWRQLWKCKCGCGNETKVRYESLSSGATKSCGKCQYMTGDKSAHYKGCGNLSGSKWNTVKKGAKKRGLELSITIEDAWNLFVEQDAKCALSGLSIDLQPACRDEEGTASLDRIDSTKGYTLDNIQWVHKTVNKMKWNMKDEELIKFCKSIAIYQMHKKLNETDYSHRTDGAR